MQSGGQRPCPVILDINMPVLPGKEVLTILRTIPFFDDIPVILFSTSDFETDKAFDKKYNAGISTKPIGYSQMEVIAEQLLTYGVEEYGIRSGDNHFVDSRLFQITSC